MIYPSILNLKRINLYALKYYSYIMESSNNFITDVDDEDGDDTDYDDDDVSFTHLTR